MCIQLSLHAMTSLEKHISLTTMINLLDASYLINQSWCLVKCLFDLSLFFQNVDASFHFEETF
jgi:hypothetical protein